MMHLLDWGAEATNPDEQTRRDRFGHNGSMQPEESDKDRDRSDRGVRRKGVTEASTGFENQTNGFDEQRPDFENLTEGTVVPLWSSNDNRFALRGIPLHFLDAL